MHPDAAAFVRAVCDAPDDDLPRLIFADWLDERGDPRGEFIRLQVGRPRLPADDPRRRDWKAREDELLRAHEEEWLGPLADVVSSYTFRRGFIDSVMVMTEAFLDHAQAIFRLQPVRRLK